MTETCSRRASASIGKYNKCRDQQRYRYLKYLVSSSSKRTSQTFLPLDLYFHPFTSLQEKPRCSFPLSSSRYQPSWLPLSQLLPATSSPKYKLAKPTPTPKQSHSTILSVLATDQVNANLRPKPNLSTTSSKPAMDLKNVKLKPRRSQSTTSNALDTVQRNEKRDLMLNLFTTLRGLDTDLRSVRLRHR
jgi:hypothetical protein